MSAFARSVDASGLVYKDYLNTLKAYGIENEDEMMLRVVAVEEELLKAILTYLMRAERFVSCARAAYEEQGFFLKALDRLEKLSEERQI